MPNNTCDACIKSNDDLNTGECSSEADGVINTDFLKTKCRINTGIKDKNIELMPSKAYDLNNTGNRCWTNHPSHPSTLIIDSTIQDKSMGLKFCGSETKYCCELKKFAIPHEKYGKLSETYGKLSHIFKQCKVIEDTTHNTGTKTMEPSACPIKNWTENNIVKTDLKTLCKSQSQSTSNGTSPEFLKLCKQFECCSSGVDK